MSAQVFKDTYLFYFPRNNAEQIDALETFSNIAIDLADGNTIIYPARGIWTDPSGIKVKDEIAIVNVSGNFSIDDRAAIEAFFQATLKELGEDSGFFNRNGLGYMKKL